MGSTREAAVTAMGRPTASECSNLSLSESTPKSTFLPVFVLFILSPLIAEVLLGATPLTHIGHRRAVVRLRGIAHSGTRAATYHQLVADHFVGRCLHAYRRRTDTSDALQS